MNKPVHLHGAPETGFISSQAVITLNWVYNKLNIKTLLSCHVKINKTTFKKQNSYFG
jgi:hypothetical protein